MKYLQLILWGLGSFFLASEVSGSASDESHLFSDSDRRDIYHAKKEFKCPFVFGSFPDPTDCEYFYVCIAGVAVHRKCGFLQRFDIIHRRCMPLLVAICGIDRTTTIAPVTSTMTTKTEDKFKCPKFSGSFPHPTDCSKYYKCMFYVSGLNTCPEKQLFDTRKSSCRPEKEVDCGTRERPGYTTTPISTESIVTEIPETISTEDTTTESATEAIRTEVVTETTSEVTDTTILRPTGPPDHNCDEDDVDCIITETGDIEDWFICPRDVGAFPHPSSDKLFIFCMNWIPSVKKCGMDLVFSTEVSTCIETTYFAELLS